MPREPQDDDYVRRARNDLTEMRRLALEGRAKIAQMQDAAHANMLEAAPRAAIGHLSRRLRLSAPTGS
jgi:hypothetical protein